MLKYTLHLRLPWWLSSKESICNASSVPGLGRPPGGGHGSPLQCSCLEDPMDRGAWWATVPSDTESDAVQRLRTHIPFKEWHCNWDRNDNPLQYSCLENPMDRRIQRAKIHRITKSMTRLKRLAYCSWVLSLPFLLTAVFCFGVPLEKRSI